MVIRDASGQITDISFSDVRHNPKLKQNLFTFEIPQGVDVIDGRQGHY
jgi:outer membrane lipoprotein carrier protein